MSYGWAEVSFSNLPKSTSLLFSDSICPRDRFVCANEKCLEAFKVCDNHNDCGDNSDEGTICSGTTEVLANEKKSLCVIQVYILFTSLLSSTLKNNFSGAICSFDSALCNASKLSIDNGGQDFGKAYSDKFFTEGICYS